MAEPLYGDIASPWVPQETFGDRLVILRRHIGLTQDLAANKCGIKKSTWNRWENGSRPIGLNEIATKISRTFGVDRGWLMWGAGGTGSLPDEPNDDTSPASEQLELALAS